MSAQLTAQEQQPVNTQKKHSVSLNKTVFDVCFSEDGAVAAAACSLGTVQLIACPSLQRIRELKTEGDLSVFTVQFCSAPTRHNYLLSGGQDCQVQLWDLRREKPLLSTLSGSHKMHVKKVSFSASGKETFSCDQEGKLVISSTAGECLTALRTIEAHKRQIMDIRNRHDSQLYVTVCIDSTVKLWNYEEAHTLAASEQQSNNIVLPKFEEQFQQKWSGTLTTGDFFQVQNYQSSGGGGGTTSNGNSNIQTDEKFELLVLGNSSGQLLIFDTQNKREHYFAHENDKAITAVQCYSDLGLILLSSEDSTVRVYKVAPYQQQRTEEQEGSTQQDGRNMQKKRIRLSKRAVYEIELLCWLKGHTLKVSAAKLSPDYTHILSGSGDRTLAIYSCGDEIKKQITTEKTQTPLPAPVAMILQTQQKVGDRKTLYSKQSSQASQVSIKLMENVQKSSEVSVTSHVQQVSVLNQQSPSTGEDKDGAKVSRDEPTPFTAPLQLGSADKLLEVKKQTPDTVANNMAPAAGLARSRTTGAAVPQNQYPLRQSIPSNNNINVKSGGGNSIRGNSSPQAPLSQRSIAEGPQIRQNSDFLKPNNNTGLPTTNAYTPKQFKIVETNQAGEEEDNDEEDFEEEGERSWYQRLSCCFSESVSESLKRRFKNLQRSLSDQKKATRQWRQTAKNFELQNQKLLQENLQLQDEKASIAQKNAHMDENQKSLQQEVENLKATLENMHKGFQDKDALASKDEEIDILKRNIATLEESLRAHEEELANQRDQAELQVYQVNLNLSHIEKCGEQQSLQSSRDHIIQERYFGLAPNKYLFESRVHVCDDKDVNRLREYDLPLSPGSSSNNAGVQAWEGELRLLPQTNSAPIRVIVKQFSFLPAFALALHTFAHTQQIESRHLQRLVAVCLAQREPTILNATQTHSTSTGGVALHKKHEEGSLALEYAPCTLATLLKQKQRFSLQVVREILIDVAQGLRDLHSHDLAHLNLRTETVFVADTNVTVQSQQQQQSRAGGKQEQQYVYIMHKSRSLLAEFAFLQFEPERYAEWGFRYAAPEFVARHYRHPPLCDIWSFGCLALHLLTQQLPWNAVKSWQQLNDLLLQGKTTPLSENLMRDVALSNLHQEPLSRPNAEKILFDLHQLNILEQDSQQ